MADLMDSLYFEEGFSIRLNSDTDPLFLLVDYSSRSYPMNMANQHYHDFYEIFMTLEDEAAHLVNGRYLQLHKGDLIFLRPQVLHMSIYPKRNTIQKRLVINFNFPVPSLGLDYQIGKIKALFDHDAPVLRLPPEYLAKLVKHINSIFTAGKARKSGWQLEMLSLFTLFMLEAARMEKHNIYSEKNLPGLPDLKMYAITEYIDIHYMEPLSLREIAEKFAISPFYLSHQFTKVMGMSFVTYVQKVRIRYALQMLSYTGARIHDIIAECGFTSSSQFNRTFSAFCGMSPSDFRKLGVADRDIIISSLDPEKSEVVPSAFPPRYRTIQKKHPGLTGMKIGISASVLSPSDPAELKSRLSLLGAETVLLDIPRCFPSVSSYSELSDKKLSEIASQNLDISVLAVSGHNLGSDIAEKREEAERECLAALDAAVSLRSPVLCVMPENGNYQVFLSSLKKLSEKAMENGVTIAVAPMPETAVDGLEGASRLISDDGSIMIVLDPLSLLHDDRENTFSFFEEVFSILGKRIVALLLRDRLEGRPVNIGKGIMAKTYPRIASLLTSSLPLIRASAESASVADDLLYIKRVFI